VIAAAALAAVGGEAVRRTLPRDVLPDLADPQIVLVASYMGHTATDVATSVTGVLTAALEGVPGASAVRGSSMTGMGYVDVVFSSAAVLSEGRRAIVERLAAVRSRLPAGVRVDVGPAASSTGWVFQYLLVDASHGQPPLELRRLQDDLLRPALAALPGVAEVASVGGAEEEALVEVLAEPLAERGLAFSDVTAAVQPAVAARPTIGVEGLEALPLPAHRPGAGPIPLSEVARIRLAPGMPSGIADLDGLGPVAGGIVVAHRDASLKPLVEAVRRTLADLEPRLPAGVKIVTAYDRLRLADRVGATLAVALAEEIGVVVLVILLFLLHARSALVPLVTLPIVVLLTFAAMRLAGVPATIMSLGGIGIALGLAVDADVVSLEACHRRLEALPAGASPSQRRAAVIAAAGSFAPAIVTSLLIAALAFLPVLAFGGETGRLLRPLALTKTFVIAAAALVAVTLAPALRDRLLRGRVRPEFANPLSRGLVRIYRPFVHFALARPAFTLVTAGLALLSCLPILHRLGGEFLPRVDEGDLLFMPTTRPGVAPHQAEDELRRQDHAIAGFKEVASVFGKLGRASSATDRAPFSMVETTIRLLPRSEWPKRARARFYSGWAPPSLRRALALVWPEETPVTTAELIESLDRATRLPGWSSAWTAPVRARMDMMSTGVRTPVGIRIITPHVDRLAALGAELRTLALGLPGTRSAVFDAQGGETALAFAPDAAALARHEVDPALARSAASLVVAGGSVGVLTLGARRLRVRVVPEVNVRGPTDELREITVRSSRGGGGQPVPLGILGRVQVVAGASEVRTEQGHLIAYLFIDLRDGVDVLRYVERAKQAVAQAIAANTVALAPGEAIEWTGQYRLLAEGSARLRWIAVAVALAMLALLAWQFRSLTQALIVLASVPFALVGSLWTLFLCDFPLSAPVWVGLLSVVGLAMQTGVVMVVYIDEAFHRRVREGRLASRDDIVAAHAEGTVKRLRPKVMTVATMAAGLLPLLWAQGAGAEIMRRIAAPMLGGLATSAFLTLEVLPVLYTIWRHRQLRRAQRTGVPIAAIVGTVPPWSR
jgi:Cu(I)/Ag(I) efflux system membrane protein CusA/SilA